MINLESVPHSRPWITQRDVSSVHEVLLSGMIAGGKACCEMEDSVSEFTGQRYAVMQPSGTQALVLSLVALGLRPGDGVVLPTYVCRDVLDSVLAVGALPQLCDVDAYGVITADTVSSAVTRRTRAIIAVHIFGNPCDVNSLRSFDVPVISDACQALQLLDAGYSRDYCGDIQVVSFHATKMITTGEGGMLLTDDCQLAAAARKLMRGENDFTFHMSSNVSDLQAALGLSQMERFADFADRRRHLYSQYCEVSSSLGLDVGISPDVDFPFRFVVRTERDVESLMRQLQERRITARRGVDELLHRLIGLPDSSFTQSVALFESNLSIPFYPSLTDNEVWRILSALEATCTPT